MSTNFKIGDKVRRYINGDCCSAELGIIYTVEACPNASHGLGIGSKKRGLCSCTNEWELVEEIKSSKNMSLQSIYKNLTRKEPEKSFVKAGITDQNDELTSEGKDLFISFLLEKNKDEFNKDVVQPILKEQEEKE